MDYKLFTIPDEQQIMLSSAETISGDNIRGLMQNFSSGKIKEVKAGKLRILNPFFPFFQDSELRKHEEHFVFFALEKQKQSFFSRPTYRVFVWPLGFNAIFALPPESVVFERPDQDATEKIFLKQAGEEHPVCKMNYGKKEHVCIFEKMQLFREFAVEEAKMTCTKDYVVHHFRWTEPDPWVREHFTLTDDKKPMFYLRNAPEYIPGWSVRLSYPSRPPLWGWEIDE